MKPAVVLAIWLVLAACGPATTPTATVSSPSPSSQPSAQPSPTPAPAGTCSSSNRCLALVTLRGSGDLIVRDITDLTHPKTLGNLGSNSANFWSSTEVVYALNGTTVTAPLSGSPATPVAGAPKNVGAVWSPDRTEAVYTSERGSLEAGNQQLDVHLFSGGTDRIVGTTPGLGAGGCEYLASCSLPNWLDSRLTFSPDGRYFSFVAQGFGASFIYIWSSDGNLLKSDSANPVTMSTWSGQTLYFRDRGGVEAWRDGATSKFLGLTWIKPSASPAGSQVVFTVRDSAGWGHIYLVDTAAEKAREIKAQRTDAVFLTSRYIWYRGERACVPTDECGAHPPFHPESGKTYIYDLQTGVEYNSVITSVADVWPHAA